MNETPIRSPGPPEDQPLTCPFCGSQETEPHAMFGSLMLMEQRYCRACRTVFERVRDAEPPEPDED